MTARECAALQSLSALKKLPASDTAAYKALGNAVNAELVEKVAVNLVGVAKKGSGSLLPRVVNSSRKAPTALRRSAKETAVL